MLLFWSDRFVFSFSYFDRLVLKNVVDKGNRRAVAGDRFCVAAFCLHLSPMVAGACLLLAIKISDDFFVSSRIYQAAVAASQDDAKRICQISNRHVPHDPGLGYEIVPVSAFLAYTCLELTTSFQDPRIIPPITKRPLNEAIRSIERVMKVRCAVVASSNSSPSSLQVGKGDIVAMEWTAFVALDLELSVSKQKARLDVTS